MNVRTIKIDYLARVEGEGGVYVTVRDGTVADVQLRIFEPPRFFEALLRGRGFHEAHDITSRICGICPVAYQMSAIHAMEDALGVRVAGPIRELRRLMYCGEWIESHGLHVHLLHAPDFLGYPDGIRMAKDHPDAVKRGLQLKKVGNEIVTQIGGREIHPINAKVGGFHRVPTKGELRPLAERLKWARDAAADTVRWVAGLSIPEFEQDYEFVALRHPDEYPFNEGRLASSSGLDIAPREYDDHFEEEHVSHSNALHSVMKGRGSYVTGPLARWNLNFDRLPAEVRDLAAEVGIGPVCRNPFRGIVVRSLEVYYACIEALRVIGNYTRPDEPAIEATPRAGTGYAATEAPRGTLHHRYKLDAAGTILDAKIVPPTSQNQKTIERDLRNYVPDILTLPEDEALRRCEQAVRNYDPCISCATHFLKLHIRREGTA